MKLLALIITIACGYWILSEGKLPFIATASAYDTSGEPLVWVFTADACGAPCTSSLAELKKRRVLFEEKRIDPNDSQDENVRLWKKLGRGTFPFVVSGNHKVSGNSSSLLAGLLAENFGEKFLSNNEKRYFKKHFYPDGTPKIVVYGVSGCPECKQLREALQAENIDFLEIDVERSGEQALISRTMEIPDYPATWVGYIRAREATLEDVKALLKNTPPT